MEDSKICYYCLGCNKLEMEEFEGVMNCKDFMQGKELQEYYKKLKGDK